MIKAVKGITVLLRGPVARPGGWLVQKAPKTVGTTPPIVGMGKVKGRSVTGRAGPAVLGLPDRLFLPLLIGLRAVGVGVVVTVLAHHRARCKREV